MSELRIDSNKELVVRVVKLSGKQPLVQGREKRLGYLCKDIKGSYIHNAGRTSSRS